MEKERLTPKQSAFVRSVANGDTLTQAYRRHYNVARMADRTVQKRAGELMANGAISGQVDRLRKDLRNRTLWTRERAARTLLSVIANPDKQADVIAAVRELNRLHGLDAPVKVAPVGPDGQPLALINVAVTYVS